MVKGIRNHRPPTDFVFYTGNQVQREQNAAKYIKAVVQSATGRERRRAMKNSSGSRKDGSSLTIGQARIMLTGTTEPTVVKATDPIDAAIEDLLRPQHPAPIRKDLFSDEQ